MKITLRAQDDNGGLIEDHDCYDPLEVLERSIKLFRKGGGEVGYKHPEDGEKFVSNITGKLLDCNNTRNASRTR